MRIKLKLVVFHIVLGMGVSAQDMINCEGVSPEWITLGMTESPSTQQSVTWRSSIESGDGEAQIIIEEPVLEKSGIGQIFNPQTISSVNQVFNDYGTKKKYHYVLFSNLYPNTRYLYRVGNNNCWSEWFVFKTAEEDPSQPFSFIYFGDVQYGINSLYPRVIRQSIMQADEASFIIFAGDLTGGATESEFNNFFKAGGWILASKSVVPVPDGHEYRENAKGEKRGELSTLWNHMFSFPETAPKDLNQMGTYYFDYHNARFIMINSYDIFQNDWEKAEKYTNWLEALLKNNSQKWTIVTHHIPLYPIAAKREKSDNWYNMLKPLYDKYRVDLVLSGHDHGYARGGIELQNKNKKRITGPVYVISVAGENKYELANRNWYDRIISDTQLFQHVLVSENQIRFMTYNPTGELYDEFIINKPGKRKIFIDKTPVMVDK